MRPRLWIWEGPSRSLGQRLFYVVAGAIRRLYFSPVILVPTLCTEAPMAVSIMSSQGLLIQMMTITPMITQLDRD